MNSGRIFFDPSSHGNMLQFLGNAGGDSSVFRGTRSSVLNMEESSLKRPIFSAGGGEEFYDEEYYDEQLPEKKRRLTAEQVHFLEKSFEAENKLEPERKAELAKKLGLQPRQVAIWFQNRRARWKTKQLERDYDKLKSSYDSLLTTYDSIRQENDKLKAELLSLNEKSQPKDDDPSAEIDHQLSSSPPPVEAADPPCLTLTVKVEDRLSTGSNGSAVMDGDGPQQLLDDSGDSYFENGEEYDCASAGLSAAKEDGGSDDGGCYFTEALAAEQEEEEAPFAWCIWS